MDKINDFRILELTVSGFKCFQEPGTFHFDYGVNFVLGDNGMGKSSIAEAIAFAFMGTGFFGEKTLDRLHNGEAKEVFVSVKLADESGEVHELTKTRKNNATGITYDGYTIRQTDLYNLFGGKDLFLSMLNPLYFIETLGTDGRNLLEKFLPVVSHEAVLNELPEEVRESLKDENILSPETYLKNRRAEIRELEEDVIYMQGQADLLESNAKKTGTELETAKAELAVKNTRLHELERFLPTEEQKADLRAEMAQLKQDSANCAERKWKLADDISKAKLNLQKIKNIKYDLSKDAEISKMKEELEAEYVRYDKAAKMSRQIHAGQKCALCRHEMTDKEALAAKEELKRLIDQCISKGKALKADLKRMERTKTAELQALQKTMAAGGSNLEKIIAEMEAEYQSITENGIGEYLRCLETKLEYGSLSQEQAAELDSLRQRCRELENEIQRLTETLEQPDVKAQIQDTQEKIEAKKRLVDDALCYMGKKNELLFRPVQMNKVQIVLSEAQKTTGEIKDVFKFTYDGKDYTKLSLSEKIRAGLEVAELLKRLSGRRYPTFLDNGESISVIDNVRPAGQLFIAKVMKGQPLAVLHKKQNASDSGRKAA